MHHLAWRVDDEEHQLLVRSQVESGGADATPVIDRFWFKSVYFKEPGGVLFELATDGPGFATDEDPAHLGERLVLPPWLEPSRGRIEAVLPSLKTPDPSVVLQRRFPLMMAGSTDRTLASPLVNQVGNQPRPPGLVVRAQSRAVLTMEVFVEEEAVAPVGILLELRRRAEDPPCAVLPSREQADHPVRQIASHVAGAERRTVGCRRVDLELRTVRGGELRQRFDQQIRRREPDRPAPVRIAALDFESASAGSYRTVPGPNVNG